MDDDKQEPISSSIRGNNDNDTGIIYDHRILYLLRNAEIRASNCSTNHLNPSQTSNSKSNNTNGFDPRDHGYDILAHPDHHKRRSIYRKAFLETSRDEALLPDTQYPRVMLISPNIIYTFDFRELIWKSQNHDVGIPGARIIAACPASDGGSDLLIKLEAPSTGPQLCLFNFNTPSSLQVLPSCNHIHNLNIISIGYARGVVVALGLAHDEPNCYKVEYYINGSWSFLGKFSSLDYHRIHTEVMVECDGSLYTLYSEICYAYLLKVECNNDGSPIRCSSISLPGEPWALEWPFEEPLAIVACQKTLYLIHPLDGVFYLFKLKANVVEEGWEKVAVVFSRGASPPLHTFTRALGIENLILFELPQGVLWAYSLPDEPWPSVQTYHYITSFPHPLHWPLLAWKPST